MPAIIVFYLHHRKNRISENRCWILDNNSELLSTDSDNNSELLLDNNSELLSGVTISSNVWMQREVERRKRMAKERRRQEEENRQLKKRLKDARKPVVSW